MKVLPTTAYCMNLDNRPDRWAQVQMDFAKLQLLMPIQIERVSAVAEPRRPQVGVAKTVQKIITNAKEKKLPYVLILEDDLYIIEAKPVYDALNNAPDDWDILSAGAYHYIPDKKHDDKWMKMKDFCSLHFIIIRDTIYDRVLQLTNQSQHLDRNIGSKVRAGQMKMYLMHPMPCQQRPGFSNIRKREVNDNRRKLPWLETANTLKN